VLAGKIKEEQMFSHPKRISFHTVT